MKRNMELIRLLLLRSEDDEGAAKEIQQFSIEERAYHAQLLVDAGYMDAIVDTAPNGAFRGVIVKRLTWQGHEFLDSIRDNSVWNKAKKNVLKPGASWTVEILKEWIKAEIKRGLGMHSHP